MNNPPISVTAHSGILSQKPQSSIAVTISSGNTVCVAVSKPADVIIVPIVLCTILNNVSISSIPFVMTALARINRTNSLTACSGFFTSAKLPQVFTTPMTKNNTSNANPIACTAEFTFSIAVQIPPPLKSFGDVSTRDQISVILAFQVSSAFCKF